MTTITLQYGTTSWTVPDDWNPHENSVTCYGAGGGGGGGDDYFVLFVINYWGGTGGRGAKAVSNNLNLTRRSVIAISIGSGGAGGSYDANRGYQGGTGGDTAFGTTVIADGGYGGYGADDANAADGSNGSASNSTGDYTYTGQGAYGGSGHYGEGAGYQGSNGYIEITYTPRSWLQTTVTIV